MKTLPLILLVSHIAVLPAWARVAAIVRINHPDRYEKQGVPGHITRDNTPADNAITDGGATAGPDADPAGNARPGSSKYPWQDLNLRPAH